RHLHTPSVPDGADSHPYRTSTRSPVDDFGPEVVLPKYVQRQVPDVVAFRAGSGAALTAIGPRG
ncbi:hypothetical protein, partial [Streptomyces griseus]